MKSLILILLIFYKKNLASGMKILGFAPFSCRFIPSCSDYTYQAIMRYGTIKGFLLGLRRLLRCNPFSEAGLDPVPDYKKI